jgi:septum formation protein
MDHNSTLWLLDEPLLLASGSRFRRALLESAGIPLDVEAAAIDERIAEAALRAQKVGPEGVARGLSEAKALAVSERHPARLVLGCDQTLALGEEAFHKPAGRDGARDHLRRLSGHAHFLHSGLALARGGKLLWSHVESARMTMRPLSEAMIEAYLDAAGEAVISSVGAYQLEALGIHLFERIEGDQSTIIGLPLLPLFRALRAEGALRG